MSSRKPQKPQSLRPSKLKQNPRNGRDRASTTVVPVPAVGGTRKGIFDPDSELGKLLRTNLSPSNVQRDEIRALKLNLAVELKLFEDLASSKRKEIARYETAISLLRDEIIELEQQAEKARTDEASASALLKRIEPIRVLPAEILGEIFLACLGARVFARKADAPLLLCRVCSAWRAIARSTPALWSCLAIDRKMDFTNITKFATNWYRLAGELPLSLVFVGPPNSYGQLFYRDTPSNTEIHQLWWERISRVDVEMQWGGHALEVLGMIGGVAPNIKYSSIRFRSSPAGLIAPSLPALLPKLRSLAITYEHTSLNETDVYDGIPLAMPWAQLTRLSMGELPMSSTTWRVMFRNCAAIEHGVFLLAAGQPAEEEAFFGPVAFSALVSLKIVFMNHGHWSILTGLTFPALCSLSLGSLDDLSMWDQSALMNIHARSLKNLALFKVNIQPKQLIDFLRTIPTLQSFLADFPLDYNPVIEQLGILNTGISNKNGNVKHDNRLTIFLPKLSKIFIYVWRCQNGKSRLDIKTLGNMVKARWSPKNERSTAPSGKCLTSIAIRTAKPRHEFESIKAILAPWRKEGLALHVGVAPKGYRVNLKSHW